MNRWPLIGSRTGFFTLPACPEGVVHTDFKDIADCLGRAYHYNKKAYRERCEPLMTSPNLASRHLN